MKRLKKVKSLHIAIVLALFLIATVFRFQPWQFAEQNGKLISWDVTSYYGYLPATYIENDLSLEFVSADSAYYHNNQMYWPETAENGNKVIKTTMGLSFLYAPFFFIAQSTDNNTAKNRGFTEHYEFYLTLSNLLYSIFGLFLVRGFLLKYYNDFVVGITLLCIYVGTNLFYYITVEPLLPHAYDFFLISAILFLGNQWMTKNNYLNSIILGILIGLLTLIRPTNGIVAVTIFLINIQNIQQLKSRVSTILSQWPKFLTVVIFAFLVLLPQLLYWKTQTGNWLFFSYTQERFYFNNPHILEGIFSYRKGWLLYTPIMIFGLIGSFIKSKHRWMILSTIIPSLFLMFSWWNWWYGGSFGCRPIVDLYPILAIGIASFLTWTIKQKPVITWSGFGFIVLLIPFNLFQTLQKKSDSIHWDSMTKEAYWHNFLIREKQPGFDELLQHPDDVKALNGEDEY